MECVATSAPLYQLWWVTGALLDALRGGGLEASVTVKRLLGHADRELKRLYADGRGSATPAAPPIELLNNLLFYVARATTRGERIDAVRSSFRLGELLPIDESVEQERESLSAPSVRLMRTVAAAIKEDLGRVKDALDLYTRKGGPPEELAPQVDLLKKIGDTLAVLGLGSVREQVQGELARLTRHHHAPRAGRAGHADRDRGDADRRRGRPRRRAGAPDHAAGRARAGRRDRSGLPPGHGDGAARVHREPRAHQGAARPVARPDRGPAAGLDAAPALARGITAGLLLLGRNRAMEVMRRIGDHVAALLGPGSLRATTSTSTASRTRSSASSTTWRRCRPAAAIPGTCSTTPSAAWSRSTACARGRAAPARRRRAAAPAPQPPPRSAARATRPSAASGRRSRSCSRSSSRKRARRSRPSAACSRSGRRIRRTANR